jgi:hypothetical protein
MTYERIVKLGKQVISLPILTDGDTDPDSSGNWAPYAVPVRGLSALEIYYVNHIAELSCPYNDVFGNLLDPRDEVKKEFMSEIIHPLVAR